MEIHVCVGTGGVGKTTFAAAQALALARTGRKTLVLTIDPARRLKTLLGLGQGAGEHRIAVPVAGELWAAQLDVQHTLDQAVRQFGRPDQIRTVLDHPIYRMLTTSLSGMDELMAVEYVDQARRKGFETLVLDTAPSRHAFEFLDKPEMFADLVSIPLVRVVGKTYRFWASSLFGQIGQRSLGLYSKLEDLVGARVVGQVLDFYSVFRSIAEGYAERAKKTVAALRDPAKGRFSVVSVPSKALRDVDFFLEELEKRSFHVHQVVLNRVWPAYSDDVLSKAGLGMEVSRWYEAVSRDHSEIEVSLRQQFQSLPLRFVALPEGGGSGGMELVESLADRLPRC